MDNKSKGKSPFYPGQPVPAEYFVGRSSEIDRIMTRGAAQVQQGKPVAMFIQGEYGIGKSSVAGFVQRLAETRHELHPIYASLGGCRDIAQVAAQILEATVRSGIWDERRNERIRNWLSKYIGDQSLFGINLNLGALRSDAPKLASAYSMLSFLQEALERLKDTGIKGIFLILDEINGISGVDAFADFVKGLVDSNALSKNPIPLMLMLCGVEERRREMIRLHQPIDRIFDVVEIGPLSQNDMEEFFNRSFAEVGMKVDNEAVPYLTHYSAGFPKIMHLVGDAAYWLDKDGIIDTTDAVDAVFMAAEDVGRKYVDQQVFRALRSEDYHLIFEKIAGASLTEMAFQKSQIESQLTAAQKKKFHNFLRRMKDLHVLRSGDVRGEYVFNSRMVRLYIFLKTTRITTKTSRKNNEAR